MANFIVQNDFFWQKENFWPMLWDVFLLKEGIKKKKWIHLITPNNRQMPNNKQKSAVLLKTANFIAHNDFFWPKENFWPMLGDVFVSKEELKKKKWIHLITPNDRQMPNIKQKSAVLWKMANFIVHNDFFWPKENIWPMLWDVFLLKEGLKKKKWIHLITPNNRQMPNKEAKVIYFVKDGKFYSTKWFFLTKRKFLTHVMRCISLKRGD